MQKLTKFGVREMPTQQDNAAMLAYLVKTMPLKDVCNIIGVILAERGDLRAAEMQQLQRRIADATWPLVGLDPDVRKENITQTARAVK